MSGINNDATAGVPRPNGWRWLNWVVLFLLVAGVALSVVLYGIARDAERQRREGEFSQLVDHQMYALQNTLGRQVSLLNALRSFVRAADDVDQDQFAAFSASLLAAESGVQALEWIPYVRRDARDAFERSAAARDPGFRIRELAADGTMAPAADRAEHFPVWLVHPLAGNARAVGFDLASEPSRRAALRQAAAADKPVATAPITLVQDEAHGKACLIFLPVWDSDGEDLISRGLRGFVLGVFRVGDVVDSASSKLAGQALPVEIVDAEAGDVIFRHEGAHAEGHGQRQVTLDAAGRSWRMTFYTRHHVTAWSRVIPLMVLGSGLLITIVFCLLVHVIARRNAVAEGLVEARTGDLRASEEKLRTMADLSSDFVFWLRKDGGLNYASPASYALCGYRADEFLAQPELLGRIVHPDDRSKWDEHWQETQAGVPCSSLALRIKTRGGQTRWVQHQCRPIEDGDGTLLGVRGKFSDITDARVHAESLERERRLFTGGPMVVFRRRVEAGWPVEYVSPNVAAMFGVEAGAFLSGDVRLGDFVHAEDAARMQQELERCVDGDETQFEQSYRIVDASGGVRFLYEITHIVRDPDGAPTHIEGYVLDVTDREDARLGLQVSRQRLDLALEGAGLGLWDRDIKSGQVHFDERWAAMLGYELDELDGSLETWSKLVHPDDMPDVEAALQAHMAGNTTYYETEHRLRHKDGHWVWVLDRGKVLHHDEHGEPLRAVGTHLDISERRRAEEHQESVQALREQTTRDLARCTSPMTIMAQACRFGQHFAGLTGGTCSFLLRLSGRMAETRTYHLWEPRDEGRLLIRLRELNEDAGEQWWRLTERADESGVTGVESAGLPASLVETLQSLGTRSLVALSIPVTAKRRYLLVLCSRLEPEAWLAGDLETLDVVREYFAHTQQRVAYRLENESTRRLLTIALQRAEQANKVKTSFLARMSHEIRTPLTAIAGLTDILERHSRNLEDVEKVWLRKVRHNSDHLVALLNDLLDLSKIDAGELQITREPVDIADVLATVDATLQPRAQEKGIILRITCSPRVPALFDSDRLRLRQILLNLAGNAVKFTDEGQVEVEADYAPTDDGSAGELTVAVRDTGIGVPEDELETIFEPFLQASGTDLATRGGTGLGLDISRRLARALGGDISVVSRVGEGSTFTLAVPLTGVSEAAPDFTPGAKPASEHPGDRRQYPELAGRRVLVVDDNPDNRQVVTYYLEEAGIRHETAENGKLGVDAALAAAEADEPFDLILMDMRMPVMNGYEAAAELRQAGCRSPIIALTAHAMDGDQQVCLNFGCKAYVSKPIEPMTLLATMARLLEGDPRPQQLAPAAAGRGKPAVTATATRPEREPAAQTVTKPERKPIPNRLPDDPRFAKLVENYRRSLSSLRVDLAEARAANDHEMVVGIAHRLHGTAANFGYPEISESARDCEDQLHAGLAPDQVSDLDQLEELLLAATAGIEDDTPVTESV